ncbi:MAG TPA: bifunctional glutamine synthetase adenylyltransferase/deadenyltransferase, partial [Pusillimonas sp.]|nr:bifunctional glutamine synthetase adenylyltransferase/deadenyltransferase [Pusillimonas sp.]
RRNVLLLERDPAALYKNVKEMRQKIAAGHPNRSELFDLKHDRGGMVDIEFITQYLVLSHACEHPVLLENLGNITLLKLASEAKLIPAELAGEVSDAYRVFRKAQHSLRLQGAEAARVPQDEFVVERDAVIALWNTVLPD